MKIINFFKSFFKSLGIIVLYFMIMILTSSLATKVKVKNANLENVIMIFGTVASIIIISIILRKKLAGQFKEFKDNYKKYLPTIFKYWSMGFVAMIIFNLIITFFTQGIAPNEEANREVIGLYPLYSIVSTCILAPIVEEFIFRLNFKGIIKKRIPYVLTTGIIFGLVHILASENLIDVLYLIPYSALGIAFSFIFYDTDNIYSSILAHAFHNTITIIVILSM